MAKRQQLLWGVAAAVWMAVVFGLSSLPASDVPGHFGNAPHFFEYAVLGALYVLALPRVPPRWRWGALAVLIASLYGMTDEFHQSFVPGRTPDPVDWLLDTAGAFAGVALVGLQQLISSRKKRDSAPQ